MSEPRLFTREEAERTLPLVGRIVQDLMLEHPEWRRAISHYELLVAGAMASEVAIMFRSRNISVVPVVDDHRTRRFLGTLSDRELVTRCLAEGKHPWHTRADALMRTNTTVVGPEHELEGMELRMDLEPNESHLRPTITVVDAERRVVGFISHPEQVPGIRVVHG